MKEKFITEEDIFLMSKAKSFERGGNLYLSEAIFGTYRLGNSIYGKCAVSENQIYDLEVNFDDHVRDAHCSCPYDRGGLCKHLVAFLLTFVFEEEKFNEALDIPIILEPLDRENLIVLISKLVGEKPDLQYWIQKHVKEILKK